MNLKDQISKILSNIKEYWNKQTPKRRKAVKIGGVAILAAAVIITVLLYMNGSKYRVLYEGMDSTETSQVMAALSAMEPAVNPQMNSKGEILVPAERYDQLLLALAEQSFPKSALTYSIETSFTATEFEKKNAYKGLLTQNITQTLSAIDGVRNVMVNLNIPDESRHVWDQAATEESSAGITVTMEKGYTLSPERVTGIKNLVASSFTNMKPENVTVIDGATGIEMTSAQESGSGVYSTQRLEYEKKYARLFEDSARQLLAPTYGAENVAVVARVELDYDKMLTESFMQNPEGSTNPDPSKGVLSERSEHYTLNGAQPAGGIAGEEDNTDLPTYAQGDPNADGGMTDYDRDSQYTADYIKRQTEKVEPYITSASLSVMINDEEMPLTDQRRVDLIDSISKATNIDVDRISLQPMNPPVPEGMDPVVPTNGLLDQLKAIPFYFWFIPFFALAIMVTLFVLLHRRKKAKEAVQEEESAQLINSLQAEIEERKKQIAEAAQADNNPSDGAIVDEIRSFAKENPEITANLIRSWLKEDS